MEYIVIILAMWKLLAGWLLLFLVPLGIAIFIILGFDFIRNKIFSEIEYIEFIDAYLPITLLIIGAGVGVFFVYYDISNNAEFLDRTVIYNILLEFYNKQL